MSRDATFRVVNVCAIMSTGFRIDPQKVSLDPSFELQMPFYNRLWIKPPEASKVVTFFYNGKMICAGNKTVAEARRNLEGAKKYLKRFRAAES